MKDDYSGKSYSGGSNDDCFDWFASHDHRPPGPKMLHVTVNVSSGLEATRSS